MKKVMIVMAIVLMLLLSGCFALPETTQSSEVSTTSTATSAATTTQTAARVTNTETRATKTPTPTPTPTPMPTPTVAPTMSPEELDSYYVTYKYKTVARDPDSYIAKFMKFDGTVVQVLESDDTTILRIAQDDDYDQMWLVNYVRPKGALRILEDDTVTVYGVCTGLITYTTTLGSSISVPGLACNQVIIHD